MKCMNHMAMMHDSTTKVMTYRKKKKTKVMTYRKEAQRMYNEVKRESNNPETYFCIAYQHQLFFLIPIMWQPK